MFGKISFIIQVKEKFHILTDMYDERGGGKTLLYDVRGDQNNDFLKLTLDMLTLIAFSHGGVRNILSCYFNRA
jgi:hypothetical protein